MPGKRPPWAQGPRAGSLAARRRELLPAVPGATDSPLGGRGLRGHVVLAQRFRFSEEPGAEGAVLEVCVPQVRAAAPTRKVLQSCTPYLPQEQFQPVCGGVGGGGGPRLPTLGWTERKPCYEAFGVLHVFQ